MANTNTITFKIGDETRPVLETGNLHESIFSELYQKAFTEINNYIGKVSNIDKNEKGGYNYEGVNNIFAFIGERGAGKTSCMMSVAKALEHKDKNLSILNGLENIKQTTFLNSVLIDPSFFDQKNNILSLIIAHLFQTFRDHASKKDCKIDEEKRRTLIACFEKVQKNLNNLFPKDNSLSTDTLEGLVNFSAAIDLQKNIKTLIDAYLNFMSEDKAKFLVLMIDDIDLHTNHAREMVEQIRKYFIQPNVVVLMAVKIDQLSNVIKNGLSEEYKTLIDKNEMSFDLINEMVERYVGKLIPQSRRMHLPDTRTLFTKKLKITRDGLNDIESIPEDQLPFLRQRVLSLIYFKTGILFYNNNEHTSYLIPRNLRELWHLISMLANMNSATDQSKLVNYKAFKNYFLNTWCLNNLDASIKEDYLRLFQIEEPTLINKHVLQIVSDYFIIEDGHDVKPILETKNKVYNISIGDVLFILSAIEPTISNELDIRLFFAIKTFYTLKLSEYSGDVKVKYSNSGEILAKTNDSYLLANYNRVINGSFIHNSISEDFTSYYYTVEEEGLLPVSRSYSEKLKSDFLQIFEESTLTTPTAENIKNKIATIFTNSKLRRIKETDDYPVKFTNSLINALIEIRTTNFVHFKSLLILIREIDDKYVTPVLKYLDNTVKISNKKSYNSTEIDLQNFNKIILDLPDNDDEWLPVLELIMLMISRSVVNEKDDSVFRKNKVNRAFSLIKSSDANSIYLDIVAPLYNLTNIDLCYSRFNNGDYVFYRSLLSDKSLLNQMWKLLASKDEKTREYYESFMKKKEKILKEHGIEKLQELKENLTEKQESPSIRYKIYFSLKEELEFLLEKIYSNCLITNIEILDQLIVNLKQKKRSPKDVNMVYAAFFEKFIGANNYIWSYVPYDKVKNTFNVKTAIDFDVYSVFVDILRSEKAKEMLNQLIDGQPTASN